ncbi:MAG: hypothetical protein ABIR58_09245 [Gemmatimonadaceae bacterium]
MATRSQLKPAPPSAETWRHRTPPAVVRRNGRLLILSVAVTFVFLRVMLHNSPESDFNVGGYNIHHLFTGLVLITAGGIPLAIFRGSTRRMDAALILFGAGLGMTLDEWIYLIATDGSNASYLLPVSFWGGVAAIASACIYAAVLIATRVRQGETRGGA